MTGIDTTAETIEYGYDGRVLVRRVADGVRTEYLVDPFGLGNVVGEYDRAGQLQANYVHGPVSDTVTGV